MGKGLSSSLGATTPEFEPSSEDGVLLAVG